MDGKSASKHALSAKPGSVALRKGRVSLAGAIYLVTATTDNRQPHFHDFPRGLCRCSLFPG
jgi:putative transposase